MLHKGSYIIHYILYYTVDVVNDCFNKNNTCILRVLTEAYLFLVSFVQSFSNVSAFMSNITNIFTVVEYNIILR